MNNVVRTSREVRLTLTIALKIHVKCYEIEDKLEEEVLEEVGGIDNDEDEHRGQIDCQDCIQDPSLEDDRHLDAGVNITGVVVGQRPVGDQVLSEHRLRLHGDDVWGDLHH